MDPEAAEFLAGFPGVLKRPEYKALRARLARSLRSRGRGIDRRDLGLVWLALHRICGFYDSQRPGKMALRWFLAKYAPGAASRLIRIDAGWRPDGRVHAVEVRYRGLLYGVRDREQPERDDEVIEMLSYSPPRDVAVIVELARGWERKEVARALGCSRQRVGQIVGRVRAAMERRLKCAQ